MLIRPGRIGRVGATNPKKLSAVVLGNLALSNGVQIGTAVTGNITGAASGSTITANIPGITINSAARTYSGTPTGGPQTISNGLIETLVEATNTPFSTAVVVAPAFVTAPVITKTSGTGVNPIAFTVDVSQGADINKAAVGMYWHLQLALDAGFTSIYREETRSITADDLALGTASFASLTAMQDGLIYARLCVERDNAPASAWSNVLTDTLASIPVTTLDTTSKSAGFVLDDTLTGHGTITGFNQFEAARGTSSKISGSVPNYCGYFEVEVIAVNVGNGYICLVQSSATMAPSALLPGASGAIAGFYFGGGRYGSINGTGVDFQVGAQSGGVAGSAPGDIWMCYFDANAGKVFVGRNGTWYSASGDPTLYHSGAVASTTSGSTTITVTTAPTSGAIKVGSKIIGTGIPTNATVTALGTGTGGTGTYTISAAATATGTNISISTNIGLTIPGNVATFPAIAVNKNAQVRARFKASSQNATYRGSLQSWGS